jgi:hypothetical protein
VVAAEAAEDFFAGFTQDGIAVQGRHHLGDGALGAMFAPGFSRHQVALGGAADQYGGIPG